MRESSHLVDDCHTQCAWLISGAVQVLLNAVGREVTDFPENSITEVYGSTLLALRGGGWVSNFQGKNIM